MTLWVAMAYSYGAWRPFTGVRPSEDREHVERGLKRYAEARSARRRRRRYKVAAFVQQKLFEFAE